MPIHQSSYEGGIDRDTSKNKYGKNTYYKMKNFRLISLEELSNGAVSSLKGNKSVTISGVTNTDDIVIGHKTIRNYFVAWTTNCHDTTGGRGTIWRCDLSILAPAWEKVYESDTMMLTTKYPIYEEAIGYYESSSIINVYWTDYFNMIRHINIAGTIPKTISVDMLNILSNVTFDTLDVINIGGGNLYVGMVQYAYQYYNVGGVETAYSPVTPLVHLTQSSEGLSGGFISRYEGSSALDEAGNINSSGKSVTIRLTTADTDYEKIRLVAILYRNKDQEPEIHVVGEYDSSSNLVVTDYGVYTKGTITLNALRTLGNAELYCKTIAQKGNKALIGNITEKFFDIDFDARAYRFKRTGASAPYSYDCKVWNTKTTAYDVIVKTGTWPNATYQIGGVDVDEEHDCICPYNYDFQANEIAEEATYDYTDSCAYMYQSLGAADAPVYGGDGPNVKYSFVTTAMSNDTGATSNTRLTIPNTVTIGNLTSYNSHQNPLRTAYLPSNKRDETYRYGLVLVNTKGQESFVKWIGDIKTPTITMYPVMTNAARVSTIYVLGIKFTIDTTGLAALGVASIKIVRVERKDGDRTILTQGAIGRMMYDVGNKINAVTKYYYAFPRLHLKTAIIGETAMYTTFGTKYQLVSPEINYLKNISPLATDYIKCQAILGGDTSRYAYISYDPTNAAKTSDVTALQEQTDFVTGLAGDTYDTKKVIHFTRYLKTRDPVTLYKYTVNAGTLAGLVEYGADEENAIALASLGNAINRAYDVTAASNKHHEGPSGTCLILDLNAVVSVTPLTDADDDSEIYLVDYKRPGIAAAQYGGLTYEARQQNTYIDCGYSIDVTTGAQATDVYGGDTYIGSFEHLQTMYEVDDNDGDTNPDVGMDYRFCEVVAFPCESYINYNLDNGYSYGKGILDQYVYALREEAGSWYSQLDNSVLTAASVTLTQEKNMYEYNSVYSQNNITKLFYPKPDNWFATVVQDTLVKISLEKVPGEEVDSFLKFLTDNEKLLPTDYGAINDLFQFKNYVIVFLTHALGTLSVDERLLLPITNNTIMELGTADNLQFFDFISNSSGSIHPSSINKMGNGFGWYDAYLNSFGYYNGETHDIGLTKGISSVIKTYSDRIKSVAGTYMVNQLYGGNFLTFQNPKNKEAYCAMIVSELASYKAKTGTTVTFDLLYAPTIVSTGNDLLNTLVVINGEEYYADISGNAGVAVLTINTTDNPLLDPTAVKWAAGKYFVYYKDLSTVFSFDTVMSVFQHEVDMFPQHLIEYNDDLFEVFNKMVIYKENEGNYGEFYDIYRYGELELLINPQKSMVCIFNNYAYNMEAYDSAGVNTLAETWHSLHTYNDYQYSVGLPIVATFVDATETFTSASHGLLLNDQLVLSGTIPTGLALYTKYFVVNVTTNTFRLAITKGGTPLTFTSSGTCNYHLLNAPLSTILGNVKRRMRTWRIKDLRDRSVNKPRMRDSYIRMLFRYKHGDNRRIIMHDLYTYYAVTRESLNSR